MKSISIFSESATTVARQAVSAQYTIPSCVKQRFWYRLLVGRNDTCTSLWSIVTVACFGGTDEVAENTKPIKEVIIIERIKVLCDMCSPWNEKKFLSADLTSII